MRNVLKILAALAALALASPADASLTSTLINQGLPGSIAWPVTTPAPAPTGPHGAILIEGVANMTPLLTNNCDPTTPAQ